MEETLYRWRNVEGICGGRYGEKCANFRREKYEKMSCFGVRLYYKTTILTIKEGR